MTSSGRHTWPRKPLSAVATVISGYAFKSSEFGDSGIPVIKIKNIRVGAVDLAGADRVDEKYLSIPERYHVRVGDVLISLTGSHISQPNSVVGRVARHWAGLPDCLLNQRAGKVIIKDRNACDPGFLYYALSERETVRAIALKAHGAANQANVSPTQVESVEIPLPPITAQRRIAGVLSAYDALMENNRRRIRVLETMARAFYRECLRDDGAESSKLGILEAPFWRIISENVAPYEGTKRYYATADVEGLTIAGEGIDYTFAERPSRAQKQPIPFSVWFARMKETHKIAWYSEMNAFAAATSTLSSGFAGFEARDPFHFPLLFLTLSSQEFHAQKDRFCTGATQMSLTNEGLARIQVPVPSEAAASRMGKLTLPMLNQMLVLQLQIQNLRRTRDLLLPRLLSGQAALPHPASPKGRGVELASSSELRQVVAQRKSQR